MSFEHQFKLNYKLLQIKSLTMFDSTTAGGWDQCGDEIKNVFLVC